LLTAVGLTACGSSTIHIYTNNTQKTTINLGRLRAAPHLCELYPGICLTTEEKPRKNLSQGSTVIVYTHPLKITQHADFYSKTFVFFGMQAYFLKTSVHLKSTVISLSVKCSVGL